MISSFEKPGTTHNVDYTNQTPTPEKGVVFSWDQRIFSEALGIIKEKMQKLNYDKELMNGIEPRKILSDLLNERKLEIEKKLIASNAEQAEEIEEGFAKDLAKATLDELNKQDRMAA